MKSKRSAAKAANAVAEVAAIRDAIAALNEEDLLDLADIFAGKASTFVTDVASVELNYRNLNLENDPTV